MENRHARPPASSGGSAEVEGKWDGMERRMSEVEINKMANRLDTLHADVAEMKSALRDLTSAINKLAIIEERQSAISTSIDRAFKAIGNIEDRLRDLERQSPDNSRVVSWMDRGLFALIGVAIMSIFDQFKSRGGP